MKNPYCSGKLLQTHYQCISGYVEVKDGYRTLLDESFIRQYSIAGKLLQKYHWLYNKEKKLIKKKLEEIVLDDLYKEYKIKDLTDNHKERIGFKSLDKINLEKELAREGKMIVNVKEYEEFQEDKESKKKQAEKKNQQEKQQFAIDPSDVKNVKIIEPDLQVKESRDLANQQPRKATYSGNSENYSSNNNSSSKYSPKKIGEWGEKIAYQALKKKHGEGCVQWLNQNGECGEGYDIIAKVEEKEIYFEIKSTTRTSGDTFEVSDTQWNWAKEQKENYIILVVTNVGTEEAEIKEYINPHQKWKDGKLSATPIKIKLNH